MPIQSYQSFRRMVKLCKSYIPPRILEELDPIQTDDTAVKEYGVNLAVAMMQELQANGVTGFHVCTLNLEKSIRRTIEKLEWKRAVNGNSSETASSLPRAMQHWDEHPNGRFGDVSSPAYGELDGWGVSLKLTVRVALLPART
jgi:methylenetetrahydrofolate reductase (NADPH)